MQDPLDCNKERVFILINPFAYIAQFIVQYTEWMVSYTLSLV